MSYLLIGNISALICDECIEPLSHARIRMYLPVSSCNTDELKAGMFSDLRLLTDNEFIAKQDRLLTSATLDERGNFSIHWEQLHLFTEPLELDIELAQVPGQRNGISSVKHYHLSTFIPHWKRSRGKYLAAFAYVVPSEKWGQIRAVYGAGVITGSVRHYETYTTLAGLRVEAYNALTDKLVGWGNTNEHGRYKLHFNVKEHNGAMLQVTANGMPVLQQSPDVYFKVYSKDHLVWSENKDMAFQPERQHIAPCSRMNLFIKPATEGKKTPRYISGWFNDLMHTNKTKKLYKDLYVIG